MDTANGHSHHPVGPIVLQCTALGYQVGGLKITNCVDFAASSYEVCGLVGPNGSGKTTFLNIVSGFVQPQEGEVAIAGVNVTGLAANRRAAMGLARTFQHVRGDEEATALENAALGLYSANGRRLISRSRRSRNRQAARDALKRTAVEEFADWPMRYLSYGTRKKVELARAIVSEPAVLLIDEPTSGVSLAHISQFETVIAEEAARGCGVVVIDHDLDFVTKVASRVVVLDVGRVIFEGVPSEAFAAPQVVEAYIGAAAAGQGTDGAT